MNLGVVRLDQIMSKLLMLNKYRLEFLLFHFVFHFLIKSLHAEMT